MDPQTVKMFRFCGRDCYLPIGYPGISSSTPAAVRPAKRLNFQPPRSYGLPDEGGEVGWASLFRGTDDWHVPFLDLTPQLSGRSVDVVEAYLGHRVYLYRGKAVRMIFLMTLWSHYNPALDCLLWTSVTGKEEISISVSLRTS